MRVRFHIALVALVLAGSLCFPAGTGFAQGRGESSAAALTPEELQTTLDAALARIAELETKVKTLESAKRSVGESLAAANAAGAQYREGYEALRLQMDAFGLDAVTADSSAIEKRLLQAVRNNQLLQDEKRELTEQLLRLAEVTLAFTRTVVSANPERLKLLEQEVQAVDARLAREQGGAPAQVATQLADAQVVDVAEQHGLVVLNAGKASGVRVGMPLQVTRGDRTIGVGLVVDVRDSIAGVLMQHLISDQDRVQNGDRVRLQTQQTL